MSEPADQTAPPTKSAPDRTRVLLITGMSGAGRSSALKSLEDMGYEAVDNLPLSLLPGLVTPRGGVLTPLAIGVDIRTRDFGADQFLETLDSLAQRPDLEFKLVFLDCEDEILRRRYTETRRRHPLAVDRPVTDGIRHERRLMSTLLGRADLVIDTSHLVLSDFKRLLAGHFMLDAGHPFSVLVMSFSYRHGIPREADLVFDVRFLSNPYYDAALRPLTGLDENVGAFVAADNGFDEFFDSLTRLLKPLMPRFRNEGKSYLTIAIGCTGGQHRSVFVAERLSAWLRQAGEQVSVAHREIDAQ